MRTIETLFLSTLLIISAFAQTNYRSKTSGIWSDIATWERDSSGTWVDALILPNASHSDIVTIQNGHTVSLTANDTVYQLTVQSSATISINSYNLILTSTSYISGLVNASSGKVLATGDFSLELRGTIAAFEVVSGSITMSDGSDGVATFTNPLTIKDGGVLRIDNGGTIQATNNVLIETGGAIGGSGSTVFSFSGDSIVNQGTISIPTVTFAKNGSQVLQGSGIWSPSTVNLNLNDTLALTRDLSFTVSQMNIQSGAALALGNNDFTFGGGTIFIGGSVSSTGGKLKSFNSPSWDILGNIVDLEIQSGTATVYDDGDGFAVLAKSLTVKSGATIQGINGWTVQTNGNVVVESGGAITGSGVFNAKGDTISNAGTISISSLNINGGITQVITGEGTWSSNSMSIGGSSAAMAAVDITKSNGTLTVESGCSLQIAHQTLSMSNCTVVVNGVITSQGGVIKSNGSVNWDIRGFICELDVESGTASVYDDSDGFAILKNILRIKHNATVQGINGWTIRADTNVYIESGGTLTGSSGTYFNFVGDTLLNGGTISIPTLNISGGTTQIIYGAGAWNSNAMNVGSSSTAVLAGAFSKSNGTLSVDGGSSLHILTYPLSMSSCTIVVDGTITSTGGIIKSNGSVNWDIRGSISELDIESGTASVYDASDGYAILKSVLRIKNDAIVQGINGCTIRADTNVYVESGGTLTGTGGMVFNFIGDTLVNDGTISIPTLTLNGSKTQFIYGIGAWNSSSLTVGSSSTVALGTHTLTFGSGNLLVAGSISATTGMLKLIHAVSFELRGSIPTLVIESGTTNIYDGSDALVSTASPIIVNGGATLSISDGYTLRADSSVTIENSGTLTGGGPGSTLQLRGMSVLNNGTISVYNISFNGSLVQTLHGSGTWAPHSLFVNSSSTLQLTDNTTFSIASFGSEGIIDIGNNDLTYTGGTFYINGTITSTGGKLKTIGTPALDWRGSGIGLEVVSGTTYIYDGSDALVTLPYPVTVNGGATLSIYDGYTLRADSSVTIDSGGTLTGGGTGSTLQLRGMSVVNSGTISVYNISFNGSLTQTLHGSGTWAPHSFTVVDGSTLKITGNTTLSIASMNLQGGGTIDIGNNNLTYTGGTFSLYGSITSTGGKLKTFGTPTLDLRGTAPDVEVDSGSTYVYDGGDARARFTNPVMIRSGATMFVDDGYTVQIDSTVIIDTTGTLTRTGNSTTLDLLSSSITNNGTVSVYNVNLSGGKIQALYGNGSWLPQNFSVLAGSTLKIMGSTTFNIPSMNLQGGGTVDIGNNNLTYTGGTFALYGSIASTGGKLKTFGTPTLDLRGTAPDVEVDSGSTYVYDGGDVRARFSNPVTIKSGATMLVNDGYTMEIDSTLTIETSGILSRTGNSTVLDMMGSTFVNNGTVAVATVNLLNVNLSLGGTGVITTPVVVPGGKSTNLFGKQTVSSLTVQSGSSFNVGKDTLILNGGFTFDGSFIADSGMVEYAGGSPQSVYTTGMHYKHLSINNASGVLLGADIALTGNLSLKAGTFATNGHLTLSDGTTIYRSGGILSEAPHFGSSVNLMYSGSVPYLTGFEMPTNETVLNNLTVAVDSVLILDKAATVNGAMNFVSGIVRLGPNDIVLKGVVSGAAEHRFIVTNDTGRVIHPIAAKESFFFPVSASDSEYNPLRITLSSGSVSDTFRVRVSNSILPSTPDTGAIVRGTWMISETIPGGDTASLSLQWNRRQEGSTFLRSDAAVWKHDESGWTAKESDSTTGTDPYTIHGSNISSFQPFVVANSGGLPVEMTTFTVSSDRLNTELRWKTATEVNNYGFEVERRQILNGGIVTIDSSYTSLIPTSRWIKVSFIQGGGTRNAPKEYFFRDHKLHAGTYTYRLKQIDLNGSFKYSQSVEVQVGIVPKVFSLAQNYPNPFNPLTTIEFTLAEDGMTTIKVYDIRGREVATVIHEELKAGVLQQVTLDGSKLSSGAYFYRLASGKNTQVKKMMLLK